MYKKTKLDPEVLKEISEIGNDKIDKIIDAKYPIKDDNEFDNKLEEAYRNIVDILKKYCDMKEEYYSLVAIWIVGTYFHDQFISYPYLFFNAMRGSGKSRILRLISILSKDGQMLNSLTEAVLFRTTGTLCIDEFEGITRKGGENLRELLNSAYKKGTSVKRMRKVKTPEGEKMEVEEFEVYRPICIANISGMENVTGDRCIKIVLEKSQNIKITKLMEIFDTENKTTLTKKLLSEGRCSLCNVVMPVNVYREWNDLITLNNTHYTNNNNNTHNTNYTTDNLFIKRLSLLDINGRDLELAMPLFLIAESLGVDVLDDLIQTFEKIIKEKREEDVIENMDVSLLDFVSQMPEVDYFLSVNGLNEKFRGFLQTNEDWVNPKWLGRSLKRLNLIKQKRRLSRGVEVILNFKKAQKQMRMFK